MPSTRQLKGRIRSVSSTKQITKAMQLVAASKMRKASESALLTQLYSKAARELLTYLSDLTDIQKHELFIARKPMKRKMIIIITSNRGLAGAYNSNVLRAYTEAVEKDDAKGILTSVIAIGRKGANFVVRLKNSDVVGVYPDMPEKLSGNELKPIIATIADLFVREKIDAVDVIYTGFINSITQETRTIRLLPAGFDEENLPRAIHPSFEPTVEEVLASTTLRMVEAQLFQAVLDSSASEHSMRMVAMKSATDNANELIEDLTLEMNKVRQAAITQELSEISGGVEAMK